MNKKTFVITTPIYYPSGNLHIGHLYTTTLAWVIANYKKMRNYDVKMLTGADEHGEKIAKKAFENKMNPQEFVDIQVSKFMDLWKRAEIDYDFFVRTTNSQHKEVVLNVFDKLLEKNIIYKGKYKGFYSINSEEFLTETQAEKKDGKLFHPISGDELVIIEEETYFFKMSLFQEWLIQYWKDNPDFVIPEKTINELTKNFLEKGLEDLSVTRISFDWGIKLRNDPKHVIYVWLDALFNYISTFGYSLNDENQFLKYWQNGDEIVQLVGKEITRFHCIYWPIFLKSLDLRIPNKILSHGLIRDGQGRKMSKSLNNVVDPHELLDQFHPEVIKYFFATQISMGQDGIFDLNLLKNIYNSHLANNFGNLVSRTIAMTTQSFENQSVKYNINKLEQIDQEIFELIKKTQNLYFEYMDNFQIDLAYKEVMNLSKELNGYIDKTTPWLLKDNLERLEVVLNTLLNGIYSLNAFLSPILKNKSQLVLEQLNISKNNFELILDFKKFNNTIVKRGSILFERIK